MKQLFAAITAASLAFGMSAPALADGHADKNNANKDYMAKSPEVVERNADGKATKVKVGDRTYDVCMTEKQDECINPRAAGLDWGDRPLGYWPGETDKES